MKTYDLYGFKSDSLMKAKSWVEKALGIQLRAHENLNAGDYFRLDYDDGENFILKKNFDPYEEEVIEDDFQDYQVLFYVNRTYRGDEIEDKLVSGIPRIKLLRREKL
jgi:hypothetical protein